MTETKKRRHIFATVAKITGWTLMAVVLFVAGLLMATLKILSPERLTPLAVRIANSTLNADVSVARAELRLRGSAPFLNLEVDSLVVISRDIASLPAAARDTLPAWSDTLLCADKISGGINLPMLARGEIRLNDVTVTRPGVNVLVVDEHLNNFTLTEPSADADTSDSFVPQISINRFRFVDPKPFRFDDMARYMHIYAQLSRASITETDIDKTPFYKIDFQSNIESPLFRFFGLEDIPVAFDGDLRWVSSRPMEFALDNFNFTVSVFSGKLDTSFDFSSSMVVPRFDINIDPVKISDLLRLIPEEIAREYAIPRDIDTDAMLAVESHLTRPYDMGDDALPYATFRFRIPESSL